MTDRKVVYGDTVEIQLDNIDRVLRRLIRRVGGQTARAILPKIPFCFSIGAVGEDGVLGRLLLPVAGTILSAQMYVGFVEEKIKPTLTVTIHYPGGSQAVDLQYKAGYNVLERAR